jgi:hypothetical protein
MVAEVSAPGEAAFRKERRMFSWHNSSNFPVGGQGSFKLLAIAGLAGVMMFAGCGEITTTPVDPVADTANATTASTTTASGGDDLDLALVTTFILPNVPGVSPATVRSARVTATINSASTDGNRLMTDYESYDFPANEFADAVCYFFYENNGTIMGGKFDWWSPGGQSTKSLVSVREGYGGHQMPASGARCWTMISSIDGQQRSNTCSVTWQ